MHTRERLDKFLSHAGIGARRDIKQIMKKHVITVNGEAVTSANTKIDPINDDIRIDGEKVIQKGFVYYMLNKPKGVISAVVDYGGRETVVDLINTNERLYPIGRLDKDTHGLLLLTNDGALTHRLIHPKYHVPKVYRLTIAGHPTKEQITAFTTGVLLRDGITRPAKVTVEKTDEQTSMLEVTLYEGRYRQIRRMCETVGIELLDLQRIAFGPLTLGNLGEGEYRKLTAKEIHELEKQVKTNLR